MSKTATNNIELNVSTKKEYTINGNPDLVIKLNPNDIGIIARIDEAVPMINELEDKYRGLFTAPVEDENGNPIQPDDETLSKFSKGFKEIDAGIRDAINFLFDYDVCSVCARDGSMFDPQDGEYRYSVIITTLISLYEDTITVETNKVLDKMKKRVEKYTAQDHKRKRKS